MTRFLFLVSLSIMLTNASCQTPKDKQINAAEKDQALYKKYNLDKIKLPEGFAVSVYAEVSNAKKYVLGCKGYIVCWQ